MLKLKLQYFGHLMWRTHLKRPWCWERRKVRREGDDRGRDGWMASPTWWTWVWASSGNWWWPGKPGMLAVPGVTKSWTQLNAELNWEKDKERNREKNKCGKMLTIDKEYNGDIVFTILSILYSFFFFFKISLGKTHAKQIHNPMI